MANLLSKLSQAFNLKVDLYIHNLRKSLPKQEIMLPGGIEQAKAISLNSDPYKEAAQYGYKQKLSLLPDTTKLMIYLRDPIVSSIIQTRLTQIAEFSRPQQDKYGAGFAFETKNKLEEISTEDLKEQTKILNDYIYNCGVIDEERKDNDEMMDFESFLKMIIRDRLIYGSCAIERVYNKKGSMHHFLPVSTATIRLTTNNFDVNMIPDNMKNDRSEFDKDEKYKYVQLIEGQVWRAFTKEELVLKEANPTNDFFTNGYGISELDLLMDTITAHLNVDKRNRSIFENGWVAPGIINFKGEVKEEQLEAFRRAYYSQGVGPQAMYRTPVINNPDGMEFIRMDSTNKDFEFGRLTDYLIKIICSMYQILPEEINFSSSTRMDGGGTGGSQNYSNVEKKLELSRDRGLEPLLRYVENIVNQELLPYCNIPWAKNYTFRFVGLDSESKQEELQRITNECKVFKTVNEARKELGLKDLGLNGDIILDATYYQWIMGQELSNITNQPQQENALPFVKSLKNKDLDLIEVTVFKKNQ